jgi:crossover junction endodeoxyribonuclease RuvC
MMRILGIDPGTIVMGYGLIDSADSEITAVDYGALVAKERSPIGERLLFLYGELNRIIKKHQPETVAIEQPFVSRNVKSAFAIGRAQAIAILAAANHHLPMAEYSPAEVKQKVTNYGASSKEQVQEMVRIQLGLTEIPQPDDAADALAIAICHWQNMRLKELLER